MNYTNPRTRAEIADWPYGPGLCTTAVFVIERTERGERAVRTTVDPRTGRINKPKVLTYAMRQRIVDGDDGKTYILTLSVYGNIAVMQSNMLYTQESLGVSDARYAQLRALLA